MAAPTFVQHAESTNWGASATTDTVSLTVQTGDIMVVGCVMEGSGSTFSVPTNDGTALTWTQRQLDNTTASVTRLGAWTAVADSNRTIVITGHINNTASRWGMVGRAWRASDGVGASAIVVGDTTTNFSVGVTTLQANSAIDHIWGDWNAVSGARTYLTTGVGTFTEKTNVTSGTAYTVGSGYHADVGATGAKTIGASAPTLQKWSGIVIEIKGTAAAGNVTVAMGTTQAVLTLSAQAPSLKAKVFPTLAALTLTAQAPQARARVSSVFASLSLAAIAPTNVRARVTPPSAILSLQAQAPTIRTRVAAVLATMQLTANTPALRAVASALTPIVRFQAAPPVQAPSGTAPPQVMGRQSGLLDEQTTDVYHHGRRA